MLLSLECGSHRGVKLIGVMQRRFCGELLKRLGLVKEDARNRHWWRSLTSGNRLTLPQCGR